MNFETPQKASTNFARFEYFLTGRHLFGHRRLLELQLSMVAFNRPVAQMGVERAFYNGPMSATDTAMSTDRDPSMTLGQTWLYARAKGEDFSQWTENLPGKWCITLDDEHVDDAWRRIRTAVEAGHLVLAKASTLEMCRHKAEYVICVYTRDWHDNGAIDQARAVLRGLGFTDELGYKRDIETHRGVYGTPDEWYRRG